MNRVTVLLNKISQAEKLDFGTIFSESIELFKKTWLQGFLLQLFTMIIMIPLIVVLYIPIIGMIISQGNDSFNPEEFSGVFAGMGVLYILFLIVGIFVLGTVSVGLNAGFFRIMRLLDNNELVITSDFFYFLKGKYLSKIFVLMIASIGIALLAVILCYLPVFYAMIPLSYFSVIFAFNPELTVGEIVKVGFKLGNKKWLISFGLFIVASILSQMIGMLLCGIGLLLTASFVYHPMYLVYKNVIGFDEETEIDRIGAL
ncbi:MAG: hypothetical protein ABJL44_08395 [Algibacter sp.]